MSDNAKWDRTVYSDYLKPGIEYVIGFGEALALAVLFRFAAVKTDSLLIDALAFLISCAVGAYAGLPLGLLMRHLDRVKTTSIWVVLAIVVPLSLGMVMIVQMITTEVGIAIDQMIKVGVAI